MLRDRIHNALVVMSQSTEREEEGKQSVLQLCIGNLKVILNNPEN